MAVYFNLRRPRTVNRSARWQREGDKHHPPWVLIGTTLLPLKSLWFKDMTAVSNFFEQNIIVIYFFYGLAFFCMGLIVWIESGRASSFRLARAMGPLAGFGIIHGLHEWFEMFQRLGRTRATSIPGWLLLDELRIGHLVVSFALLVIFGVRLLYSTRRGEEEKEQFFAYVLAGALLGVWLLSVLVTRHAYDLAGDDLLTAVDILSRYILGIPGAVLAAWAIVLEQRSFRSHGMSGTGRDLQRAALAMLLYGVIGQAFPQASFLFPANVVNADLFNQWFGVPIQLFRAVMAALIAFFVIRALRAFEVERQRNLAAANEAKLAAQREALAVQAAAREETESLNAELQTAVQELTVLFELSRRLVSTTNLEALLVQAVDQIVNGLPRLAGGLILLRETVDKPPRCAAQAGYPIAADDDSESGMPCLEAQQVGEQVLTWAKPACKRNGDIIPCGDAGGASANGSGRGCHTIGVPLSVQAENIGSLVLSLKPEQPTFTARDLALIDTIASLLSIAVENGIRYRELQAREELRGELLHQAVKAQEQERQRIARELHDSTGQTLTALGLGFAAASETVKTDPVLAAQQLTELKVMSTQALQDLRDMIHNLRPSMLDDLGLVPALKSLVQRVDERLAQTSQPVDVQFRVNGRRRRVQPDIETIIFRIAQEALTNITKHAAAQNAAVSLQFGEDELTLRVFDDGQGFDPEVVFGENGRQRRAWGLLGMQERVGLVGGEVKIESARGQGTIIQVTIPLKDEEGSDEQN